MPKRANQPSKIKRSRRHGFIKRSSTTSGVAILKRRRFKKRSSLSA